MPENEFTDTLTSRYRQGENGLRNSDRHDHPLWRCGERCLGVLRNLKQVPLGSSAVSSPVYANRNARCESQPLGWLGAQLGSSTTIGSRRKCMNAELTLPDTSYGRDTSVEVKLSRF